MNENCTVTVSPYVKVFSYSNKSLSTYHSYVGSVPITGTIMLVETVCTKRRRDLVFEYKVTSHFKSAKSHFDLSVELALKQASQLIPKLE